MRVTIGNGTLETTLKIINTDEKVFTFTGVLRTYLQVKEIKRTAVEGFQGIDYCESSDRQTRLVQKEKEQHFNGEIDRFYITPNRH